MVTPLVVPAVITQAWALNGSKNTIPTLPDATPGHASLDLGFPTLTMTPIQSGGVPPSGLDFNGIFNLLSQHSTWLNGGGQYTFNAALVTATGGYKIGCVIQSNDGLSSYVSRVNSNTVDFNTTPASIGVQWDVYGGAAAGNSAVSVATTGGSTTLTAAQYNAGFITVTGLLVSNATLVFPNFVRRWSVINNTTGAFTLTVKAAATAGVPVRQGVMDTVVFDGSAIGYAQSDTVTRSPLDNSTAQASTAYVDAAVTAAVVNVSKTYVNANFSASSSGDLCTDTRAGGFTITLPDPPIGKNIISISDFGGVWDVNKLLINPGTKTILGASGNLVCDVAGMQFNIWYDTTTWRLN